ncbi:MAG TPA: hypothetical protein VHH73_16530, partial [Verrucomicrobiae bacterium]|nr:hypothetical protein [Verrucomicrobiae bacterium]
MRRMWLALFPGILAMFSPNPGRAQAVLVSGNSMDGSSPAFTTPLNTLGFTCTFVGSGDFGTTSLAGYSAVWLDGFSQYSPGTPGNPGLSASALTSFMNAGGVVIVQNPGFGSEAISLYPFGNELTWEFTYDSGNPASGENTIQLTSPAHP